MSAMQQKIASINAKGRPAVVASIVAGFPAPDKFFNLLENLDAGGADIIEVGIPFSDPAAEGPLAEEAGRQALKNGVSLTWLMKGLKERAGKLNASLTLCGYMNPFYQYGFEKLSAEAAEAGVSAIMPKDLPLEEAEPFQKMLAARGLDLICLIGPNTPKERMEKYAKLSGGYALLIGGPDQEKAGKVAVEFRRAIKTPLAVVAKTGDMARLEKLPVSERPDVLVFGEVLLDYLKNGGAAAEFLKSM